MTTNELEALGLGLKLPLTHRLAGRRWFINGNPIGLTKRQQLLVGLLLTERAKGGDYLRVTTLLDLIEKNTAGTGFWQSPDECEVRRAVSELRTKLGSYSQVLANQHSLGYRIEALSQLISLEG